MMKDHAQRSDLLDHCRACGSGNLMLFLPMGDHPPANMFVRPEDRDASGAVEVEDLLTGQRWRWGRTPYVRLDPNVEPAHVLRVVRNG